MTENNSEQIEEEEGDLKPSKPFLPQEISQGCDAEL